MLILFVSSSFVSEINVHQGQSRIRCREETVLRWTAAFGCGSTEAPADHVIHPAAS